MSTPSRFNPDAFTVIGHDLSKGAHAPRSPLTGCCFTWLKRLTKYGRDKFGFAWPLPIGKRRGNANPCTVLSPVSGFITIGA
jgi:hypothetical protein